MRFYGILLTTRLKKYLSQSRTKNCKKSNIDYVFVDLYKELIGTIKDKPPCIECSDFTIDNCAKTSCECIKFKRYVCISKAM